jgi:hypothetical protein
MKFDFFYCSRGYHKSRDFPFHCSCGKYGMWYIGGHTIGSSIKIFSFEHKRPQF